jgi:hypothetical protein
MPHPKLARRFEPRGGVSQSMLDHECKYVGRELDDFLLYSIAELRTRFSDLSAKIATAEEELEPRFRVLPDRERLALKCLIARDQFHLAMLYRAFLASSPLEQATGASTLAVAELSNETDEAKPILAFRDWLFE